MSTKKLYMQDTYQKSCTANVLSKSYGNQKTALVFDQTVFFPEGGGQSCDQGTLIYQGTAYQIVDVHERGGEVVHYLEGEVADIPEGAAVELTLDWDRRFDNMQRHLGEHILSGAIYRLFGGHNKGFHMGEDGITIDIAFDEDSANKKITWDMALAAEAESNRVIWADTPVRVDLFATREEADKLPLRKPLAFDEDISIVTVGDLENPMDCVACCGTHPSTAGQVGMLKIYKIVPNKGMSRLTFEVGQRAFQRYQQQFDTLYDLSNRLSTGIENLREKFDAQENKTEALRQQLHNFREKVLAAEAADLQKAMVLGLVRRYDDLSVDDLFNMSKFLKGQISGIIALVASASNTVLLLSDGSSDWNCGALIKESAATYGGRGGGKPDSARAFFQDAAALDQFLAAALPQAE